MYKSVSVLGAAAMMLAACAQPGANLGANVYQAGQINQRQEARVVNILATLPAKVEVSNAENQRTAQLVGGLLGAGAGLAVGSVGHSPASYALGGAGGAAAGVAAGSLVPGRVLVDGVSLTYEDHGQTFNSAQVGKLCEFKAGRAIVVSTGPGVTRIQPNATCPAAT
jgi:outer membrane lipoprotein SlyB